MLVVEDKVLIFYSLFSLMAKFDDEESNKVTRLDIKENLKDYSFKVLRSLSTVLIDLVYELTKEKYLLNNTFDELEVEKVETTKQLSKL